MQEWFIGEGDAWSILVRGIAVLVFLFFLIGGFAMLVGAGLRKESAKFRLIIMVSLLWFPAMFSTCSTINWTGRDMKHDVFGFERSVNETRGGGFQTKSNRRAEGIKNVFGYLFSAHGILSILAAVTVGLPFLFFVPKAIDRLKYNDDAKTGYYLAAGCLAIVFIIIWNNS